MARRKKISPEAESEDPTKKASPQKQLSLTETNSDKENENKTNSNRLPPKRVGGKIHATTRSNKKQNNKGNLTSKIKLQVLGYAFQDDIIGVTHIRSDGEDAFNLTLRNMILGDHLQDKGFSSYVTLRDKNSGKDDDHLVGADGYPRYMFMSINVHKFDSVDEASDAVMKQCQRLHSVSEHCAYN